MTTTPTVWKAEFTANLGITTGGQFSPVTIGLADDRILIIWVDDANSVDNDPNSDIIGQIYDALGNAVGGAFQLNQANFLDGETNPAIAALPDGGFVVAYEDRSLSAGGDAAIRFERYNTAGVQTAGGTIASGTNNGVINSNPSVAAFANGDFVVSYQQFSGGDTDVIAKVVNGATNVAGPTLNAGQNSADLDADPDIVVLSSGDILTAYEEADGGVTGIEAQLITTAGALLTNVQVVGAGIDPNAAALAGGGFVLVWQDAANNGDIRAEVRNNNASVVTGNFLVQGGANNQNEPEVIALKDGGFFVVWDDDTAETLFGQRFSATGGLVGTTIPIATGANISEPELGLTDDGRILVTFQDAASEISQVILDPRDNVINGDGTGETITLRVEGATVNGNAGDDVLLGLAAADMLDGGDGADLMLGAGGNDTYVVDDPGDIADESAAGSDGVDTVLASISFSLSDSVHAKGDIENLTLTGDATNGTGNALANTLVGNALANILDGLAGADLMQGVGGNDTYTVDDPGDVVDEAAAGSEGIDTVLAAASFTLGVGVENLTLIGGSNINGTGNELANVLVGNTGANLLGGGLGHDTLTGGAGLDGFVFNTALDKVSNVDTIADFSHADDTILLDNAIFAKLKKDGALKKKYFEVGKKADDGNDFIVYNKKTGDLFYDKNGDKKGGAILFAHLDGGPDDLSKADFFVV